MPVRFIYGIKVSGYRFNLELIREALALMKEKTPEFFQLAKENVKEIREKDSEVFSLMRSPLTLARALKDRIIFPPYWAIFFDKYAIASFIIHETYHIKEGKKGLPYTKDSEIRARQAQIAFLKTLAKTEGANFEKEIKSLEEEINSIV